MTVKLAKSSSLVFGIFCAIATTPLLFSSVPGNTQAPSPQPSPPPGSAPAITPAPVPTSGPSPATSPIPSPTGIPTLNPELEPTPTPALSPSPAISPQPEPTSPASPAPAPAPAPVPAPTPSPAPAPTVPTSPSTTPPTSSSNSLSRYSAEPPVLRIGSTGQPVQDIQTFLKAAGLYTGAIDGVFGAETEAAVKKFQESNNLASDGIIGPATWAVMLKS